MKAAALTRLPARTRTWVVRRAEGLPGRTRRILLVAVATAVVLAVAGVGVLGWALHRGSAADGQTQSAVDAARTGTEKLLTINSETVDADLARSGGLITEPFATQFEQTATDVIAPGTRAGQLLTTTQVVRSALISSQPGRVEVLLFLKQFTTARAPVAPADVTTSQVRETVIKVGDRWLISEFQVL
jgi:Mce-associated membrane protein